MARKVVSINTRPVASHYASSNEKIIEFTAPNGEGGLINFSFNAETGELNVALYGLDSRVKVTTSYR